MFRVQSNSKKLRQWVAICFLLLSFFVEVNAQNFGFEWTYNGVNWLKFPVTKNGVYKLNAAQLQMAGWQLNQIKPKQICLYQMGNQVPLYLELANAQTLQSNDVLYFYARKNEGQLDQFLYDTPDDIPHTYNSLLQDTAWYFIGIDTSVQAKPLRFTTPQSIDTSALSAFTTFENVSVISPDEFYYRGKRLPSNEAYYVSAYAGGESWSSNPISKSQSRIFTVSIPPLQDNTNIHLKAIVMGVSDYFVADNNAPNHHVIVSLLSKSNTYVKLIDTTYRRAVPVVLHTEFAASLTDTLIQIKLEIPDDLNLGADVQVLSLLELKTISNSIFGNNDTVLLKSNSVEKGWLKMAKTSADSTLLFNLSDLQACWIKEQFPFQTQSSNTKFVCSAASFILPVEQLQSVSFSTQFADESIEYIIVSSKKIETAAKAYQQYRSAQFKTKLYYIEDLANHYAYGQIHPIAIQRLCSHLKQLQAKSPRYLFLLGKGYQIDLLKNDQALFSKQLVPIIGDPVSDQLFTEKLNVNGSAPGIPTGRLAAETNQEVMAYLNKLIDAESNPDSIAWWRKQIVQVSGGEDYTTEQLPYTQVLKKISPVLQKSEIGYCIDHYFKDNSLPTTENIEQKLLKIQNEGVQLFTFLGHGSLSVLDVPIGSINQLQNTKKPALYYLNGCAIGNPASTSPQGTGSIYANDYLCANQKGAIAWLAHSNITLNTPLFLQMEKMYQAFAKTNFTIAEQIQQALLAYTSDADAFKIEHARQLILQGDPAYRLYQPTYFDLHINTNSVYLQNPSNNNSFNEMQLAIAIQNLGRSSADSVQIYFRRTLPNQQQIQLPSLTIKIPDCIDTFYYTFQNDLSTQAGLNSIEIKLGVPDSLHEYNAQNNQTNFSFFLPGQSVQVLNPLAFSTVNKDAALLTIQRLQASSQANFVIEIDSNPNFSANSPAYHQYILNSSKGIVQQTLPLLKSDSTVYWWSVKNQQDSIEIKNTFQVNLNQSPHFSQSGFNQFSQWKSSNQLKLNTSNQSIEFADNLWQLGIENRRFDHRMMGVTSPYLLNEGVGNCLSQGIVVLVFNPNLGTYPVEIPAFPFNCAYVQTHQSNISNRYYTFNTNTLAGEQAFVQFVKAVPADLELAIFSRYASNIQSWQPETKQVLTDLGAKKIPFIKSENTAWALLAAKASPAESIEDTVSNEDLAGKVSLPPLPSEPQDLNILRIQKQIKGKWYEGNFTTQWIGPAKKFKDFKCELNQLENTDIYQIEVYVKTQTNEDSLLTLIPFSNSILLAKNLNCTYPFLKFKFYFKDSTNRTSAQLKNWSLSYVPMAELAFDPYNGNQLQTKSILQGEWARFQIPIRNLAEEISDSSQIQLQILDSLNRLVINQFQPLGHISSNDTLLLDMQFPTALLSGKCQLVLTLNPNKDFPEIDYSNNYYKSEFNVESNSKMPDLTVFIDGRKIVSGELISAKPQMEFQLTNVKAVDAYKDSIPFEVKIRKPKQIEFETLNLRSSNFKYIPPTDQNPSASLQYAPELLSDGMYTLMVKPIDPFANWIAPVNEFQFEIKQAESISHFYPYPNPFTTQMRFVFRLTGSEIPDKILVRIFTVDGRLIKEINQDELGDIHIGNNISSWYWDGKDQFGEQLANGVYFYTVNCTMKGNSIEINQVNANENQFFKAHTGKIYLMR